MISNITTALNIAVDVSVSDIIRRTGELCQLSVKSYVLFASLALRSLIITVTQTLPDVLCVFI